MNRENPLLTRPVIYEINTFVWLQGLSEKYGRRIDLSSVPTQEWDQLANLDCDAVWLMGVWQRSEASRKIALSLPYLVSECRRILPDFTSDDIPGSPYSVKDYRVEERLGDLRAARNALAERGLKLILDFVPNHVSTDHKWVTQRPEYFIHGAKDEDTQSPQSYFRSGANVIAFGRDPYFPAWTDTAQLNAFSPALRSAAIETLHGIAAQCDGVRCDMAMLLLSDVFKQTWGTAAGQEPETEYWADVISATRQAFPNFLFMAEAYWNREWHLQQLGFDYCYDKRLYDRLVHDDAVAVRSHLNAGLDYQERLIRFLENHDEERAAAALPPERHRAAAVAIATLPGAILYYDGQFCGHRERIPVQLGRGPAEPCDMDLFAFYSRLRAVSRRIKSNDAKWTKTTLTGWPDNETASNILSWYWNGPDGRFLMVINFSAQPAQGRVHILEGQFAGKSLRLTNLVGTEVFERDGTELQNEGLYVALEAWQCYALQMLEVDLAAATLS